MYEFQQIGIKTRKSNKVLEDRIDFTVMLIQDTNRGRDQQRFLLGPHILL